jgi:hypothetical protein
MKEILLEAKFISSFASSFCFAGRIASKLWWTNQEFSPTDIRSWFSMLIYHVGVEQ